MFCLADYSLAVLLDSEVDFRRTFFSSSAYCAYTPRDIRTETGKLKHSMLCGLKRTSRKLVSMFTRCYFLPTVNRHPPSNACMHAGRRVVVRAYKAKFRHLSSSYKVWILQRSRKSQQTP